MFIFASKTKQLRTMRKLLFTLSVLALLCTSCATTQNAGAVMTGAAIGNNVGGTIGGLLGDGSGGRHGAFRGSSIGSLIGTVAGAVIANEMTKPREEKAPEEVHTHRRPAQSHVQSLNNAQLKIRNIRFIDQNRNHTINSQEVCKIIFEIVNESNRPAHNVVPIVEEVSGMKHIYISPSTMVERLAPHDGIRYTATLESGKRIKDGHAIVRVAVANEYGEEADWQEFEIPTRR